MKQGTTAITKRSGTRWLRWILAWLPMVFIAIANGALRDLAYGPHLGELRAQQLSTITGIVLFGFYIRFVVRAWRPESGARAAAIGALWLVMTLVFEFVFGHWVAGQSWSALFANYDLLAGRLWPLIPIWIGVAPWLFYRLRPTNSFATKQ